MRIVAFVEYFPPKMGSDRRIFELMKRLSQRHKIHFIVFPSIKMLISGEYLLKKHRLEWKETVVYEGIKGHFIKIPRPITEAWRSSILMAYLLTSPLLLIKTALALAELKPDAIVLNYPSPYTGLLGFISGKIWRKPIILDFNDLIAQYTIDVLHLEKKCFSADILLCIQNYIAKNSQRVIAPTFFIKKYAIAHKTPATKITVIPNGADTEKFNPQKYETSTTKMKSKKFKEKICVYCGRLDSWAGINIILKLCGIALDKRIDVKFVLVGSGEHKMPLKENIVLYRELPYEEIPHILAMADVILVPFPNNEISHAASPLKLFEGMAMQKPVIASRVKGIEEVISDGENGFLADPEKIEEWLTKLQILLHSEREAERAAKNARRTIEERFNWNDLAKQFEKVLTMVDVEHHKHY
jgi:glycosyltransferase involved in cell wall biosynthesis